MSDNKTITAGQVSCVVATDEISGVDYQLIKLAFGANGVATLVSTSDGLPIQIAAAAIPAGAASLTKAVDAAAGASDVGVALLGVRVDAPTTLTPGNGDYANLRLDASGRVWTYSGGGLITLAPATSGGCSKYSLTSDNTNNATAVKAAPGQVFGWDFYNNNAAVRVLKLYNQTAAPNPASDTPFLRIPVPPGGKAQVTLESGIEFSTGIAFAMVTGLGDSDNTAVGANDLTGQIFYK